jgi:hypothetical protein
MPRGRGFTYVLEKENNMKNKITRVLYTVLLAASVLGFINYPQRPQPNILSDERADQKVTFDYHQAIYNNKANSQARTKTLLDKKEKEQKQEKQIVEETQDQTKGQILLKF